MNKTLKLIAVHKVTGDSYMVYGTYMNQQGEIEQISLEPKSVNACWEPAEEFYITPVLVDITNVEEGA